MKLEGHIEVVGKRRNAYKILIWNFKGRDHLRNIGVYGRIILKRILKNSV
jgi:hypothetical protein